MTLVFCYVQDTTTVDADAQHNLKGNGMNWFEESTDLLEDTATDFEESEFEESEFEEAEFEEEAEEDEEDDEDAEDVEEGKKKKKKKSKKKKR